MAMSSIFSGRVANDQTIKNANGVPVINFDLAVERDFTDKSGNRGVDYISFVAWDKTASVIANYIKSGNLLSITSADVRVNQRTLDGIRISDTVNTVNQFEVLSVAAKNRNQQPAQEAAAQQDADAKQAAEAQVADEAANVDLDDLPF